MIGVEFTPKSVSIHDPNIPAGAPKDLASRVAKRCLEKGLLILTTSVYEVVRFIPPFTQALEEVVKEG